MSDDTERGRGILSQADRAYLRNPDDYSRQAANEREKAIKQRLTDSVLDFWYLAGGAVDPPHLDADQRKQIFADMDTQGAIYHDLTLMVVFACHAAHDAGVEPEEVLTDAMNRLYTGTLTGGDRGRGQLITEVSVEINKKRETVYDKTQLYQRFQDGDELTDEEVGYLLRDADLDEDEVTRLADS